MKKTNNLQPVKNELALFLNTRFPVTNFNLNIEKADGQEYIALTWENDGIESEVRETIRSSKFSEMAYIFADVTITKDHNQLILAQAAKMNFKPEKIQYGWAGGGAVYRHEYRPLDYTKANKALYEIKVEQMMGALTA